MAENSWGSWFSSSVRAAYDTVAGEAAPTGGGESDRQTGDFDSLAATTTLSSSSATAVSTQFGAVDESEVSWRGGRMEHFGWEGGCGAVVGIGVTTLGGGRRGAMRGCRTQRARPSRWLQPLLAVRVVGQALILSTWTVLLAMGVVVYPWCLSR